MSHRLLIDKFQVQLYIPMVGTIGMVTTFLEQAPFTIQKDGQYNTLLNSTLVGLQVCYLSLGKLNTSESMYGICLVVRVSRLTYNITSRSNTAH